MTWPHFHCWHKTGEIQVNAWWGSCQKPSFETLKRYECCRCVRIKVGVVVEGPWGEYFTKPRRWEIA